MDFTFDNPRPDKTNGFSVTKNFDNTPYENFPLGPGKSPFRLDLTSVLGPNLPAGRMVFHTVGDTGSVKEPADLQIVAQKMVEQFGQGAPDNPLFFYHLGDVVYFYGEAAGYPDQYFEPYQHYPAPIFAIAGNHDGQVDPTVSTPPPSLTAFREVFCSPSAVHLPIAGESARTTMIQPNVYWTLETPMATFIGVYCNVTQHGEIREPQISWFREELKYAQTLRNEKALIVGLHYPAYSVDKDHGANEPMQQFLDQAFQATGVQPDLVLSGHVHNYQRFTRTMTDGAQVPYIVAGAGGYWLLHAVQTKAAPVKVPNSSFFPGVVLNSFCDDRHGFLRITLSKTGKARTLKGEYFTVPRAQEAWSAPAVLFDTFTVDLNANRLQTKRKITPAKRGKGR